MKIYSTIKLKIFSLHKKRLKPKTTLFEELENLGKL